MSNMNFLIAYVIRFSSDTKITFSKGDASKILNFSSFQSFAPELELLLPGQPVCLPVQTLTLLG